MSNEKLYEIARAVSMPGNCPSLEKIVDAVAAAVREVDSAMIDRALGARVPGGAKVRAWLPMTDAGNPHETAREVIACALRAALDQQEPTK